MKVAFITPQYPNISLTGGALYCYHLCHALKGKCDLTVYLPDINSERLKDDNINYNFIKVSKKPIFKTLSFVKNVSRNLDTNRYDIIHVNEVGGFLLGKLDILTLHHVPDTPGRFIHATPVYLEAFKAKKILTVSDDSRKMLSQSKLIDENRISVVPNGINPIFLNELNNDMIDALEKKYEFEDKKVIFYVNSNCTERKNLPLMIDTAIYLKTQMEEFRLAILCKDKYRETVKKTLKQANVEDITIVVSDLSDEELVHHYALADLLAMPSTREGFGFPLIEALAVGTPFVSFDVGVATELVQSGFGKIAISDEDFKIKCMSLLDRDTRYDNSRKFIRDNYSWDKQASKVISLYEAVI